MPPPATAFIILRVSSNCCCAPRCRPLRLATASRGPLSWWMTRPCYGNWPTRCLMRRAPLRLRWLSWCAVLLPSRRVRPMPGGGYRMRRPLRRTCCWRPMPSGWGGCLDGRVFLRGSRACRPQRAGASPPRRAAQRDTDRLSSRKSRSQAEVGPCKGPLQRLGRVNGIPVQTAGILCY